MSSSTPPGGEPNIVPYVCFPALHPACFPVSPRLLPDVLLSSSNGNRNALPDFSLSATLQPHFSLQAAGKEISSHAGARVSLGNRVPRALPAQPRLRGAPISTGDRERSALFDSGSAAPFPPRHGSLLISGASSAEGAGKGRRLLPSGRVSSPTGVFSLSPGAAVISLAASAPLAPSGAATAARAEPRGHRSSSKALPEPAQLCPSQSCSQGQLGWRGAAPAWSPSPPPECGRCSPSSGQQGADGILHSSQSFFPFPFPNPKLHSGSQPKPHAAQHCPTAAVPKSQVSIH